MIGRPPRSIQVLFFLLLAAGASAAVGGEIHDAARRNDLNKVKELLHKDPKIVNALGSDNVTPLHEAVRFADEEMINLLLDNGADINARCYNQFAPLHLAKDAAIAKLLIRRGADKKASSSAGTPLQYAIHEQNIPMIELLLEATGETLDFDSQVKLGRTASAMAMLKDTPWLAKPPSKALHSAADDGNLELCNILVKHGADPNQDYGFGNIVGPYTPLTGAVTGGFEDIAKLLLDHGADPNVSGGRNHDNLFIYAIAYCTAGLVKAMLDHGADTQAGDRWGDAVTPLHVAAALGGRNNIGRVLRVGQPNSLTQEKLQAVDKVSLLIDAGADVNASTDDHATPLLFAAVTGHRQVCEVLLKHGAKLDISSACLLGNVADVEAMLKANPKLATTNELPLKRPLLHWVAATGNLEIARQLLDLGADPNAEAPMLNYQDAGGFEAERIRDEKGETPLHVAAGQGHHEIVRLLIEKGANLKTQADRGVTALYLACVSGNEKVVQEILAAWGETSIEGDEDAFEAALEHVNILKTLLSSAGNPRLSGERGSKLLALAANRQLSDAVQLLIEHGAEPDIFTACILGRVDDVRRLIEANPELVNGVQRDYPSFSAIALAVRNGHADIVELLVSKGAHLVSATAKKDRLLHEAASQGHQKVLDLLVAHGLKLETLDDEGNSLLHAAARGVQPETISYLFAHGANVRVVNHAGKTPLHAFASVDDPEIERPANFLDRVRSVGRLLIDAGSDVNAKDKSGWTPLHYAAVNGQVEIAALLLEAGADVNARNQGNETPLKRAGFSKFLGAWERDTEPVEELLRKHGGIR